MSYAISAGHQLTLEAAEAVLQAGGNAADAATAGFFMSWIAEPCMSSAGGGGFAQVFFDHNPPEVFDFFCQTPKRKLPVDQMDFFPITVDFGATKEVFHVGRGATAVPGSVAGIFALHERYGRMPMQELVKPAIRAAHDGVEVTSFNFYIHELLKVILELHPMGKALFFKEDDLIEVGAKRYMPQLADYLDYLSREGVNAFYRGEVARKIVQDQREYGGCLQLSDLEDYSVQINQPLHIHYRNHLISANPFPSLGGYYLQSFFEADQNISSGDTPFSAAYLDWLFSVYQKLETVKGQATGPLKHLFTQLKTGGTTHFNVMDQWGNAVSLSSSNGEGSGCFVEGTDIQLNNMLGEAALLPGGFHSWQPDTRLSSLMTPTLVFDENRALILTLGSSGAGRIASALFQTIYLVLTYDLELEEAVNGPRAHFQENIFNMEPGFSEEYRHPDDQFKKWDRSSLYFGGVNALENKDGRWFAFGDQRRAGVGKAVNQ